MSLFGNKTQTYVFTSISPLMDDQEIPNSLQAAVLKYIRNGGDLPQQLLAARQYSMPIKMRRINKWVGEGTDKYVYGALKSTYTEEDINLVALYLQTYLSTLVGYTVTKPYVSFGSVNNYHAVWDILIRLYGYNPTTNVLGTLTSTWGTNCYFHDAQISYVQRTIDAILDPDFLNPLPGSVAFTSGATQSRSEDLGRAHTAHATHSLGLGGWGSTVNKDLLYIYYTFRRVTTRTEVFNDTLATTISDNTVTDIAEPSGYYSVSSAVASSTTSTESVLYSTPPDVFHSIRTVVTVTNYDYIFKIDSNFLEYESSGYIDEDVYLGDTNTINPSIEGDISSTTVADNKYIMAYYTYNDGSPKQAYLTYKYGSGLNTDLDNVFNTSPAAGRFYPKIYMRRGGINLANESLKGTPAYKSSTRLCKRLGFNWADLSKQIHEGIGELGDVTQISIMAVAPLNTTKQPLLRYLHAWFKNQYYQMTASTYVIPGTWIVGDIDPNTYSVREGQSMDFKDQVSNQSFRFRAIGIKTITGSIGSIGTVSGTFIGTYHRYRLQTTATEYEEVLVFRAQSAESVFGGKYSVARAVSEELMIPLDFDLVDTFNFSEREAIINNGMHIVVNTVKFVKEKWYQSGFIKGILFIAAFVMAIPTAGQSLVVWALTIAVEITIIRIVAKLLVDVFNVDIDVVLAIVAVISLMAGGYAKFNGTKFLSLTAKELLMISNIAFKLSQEGLRLQTKNLADERESFMDNASLKQAEVDAAKALITQVHKANDYLLMSTNMSREFYVIGESPTDFYNRTVHSGNVGALLPVLISSYANLTLMLPEPQVTLNRIA